MPTNTTSGPSKQHFKGQYSWWSYRANARQKNIGWRIDYFVVDEKSDERVLDAGILTDIMGSDHCSVSLRFC